LKQAPVGARYPRLVLGLAIGCLALLGVVGIGVEHQLEPTNLSVPGTESFLGNQMIAAHFGESAPFVILLRGPTPALDREGPRLVNRLRRDPKATTVSPWDRGVGLEALRPHPRTALILVDFHVSVGRAIRWAAAHMDRVAETVSPPVEARAAGFASIAKAIQDKSVEVTRRGEAIVLPILLLVLLLVFRSPIAAAIPLAFGATTVIVARGVLSALASYVDISAFALSIASMIGLALGVDYALLIVSRFREELDGGATPVEAATVTRMTAGRTTVFAGSTLFMAILIAVFLVPGMLLFSLCTTVVAVVVIAVAGPWLVGPAILVLVGDNIDRWRIGPKGQIQTRWLVASRSALRHRYGAAAISALVLILVAVPALALTTGPLTVKQLPADDRARQNVEAIETAVGGGWIAPAVVVAVDENGPVTKPKELAALQSWQSNIARYSDVKAVIGPGSIARRVSPLLHAGRSFVADNGAGSRLSSRLDRAEAGLSRLREGLGRASEGARRLALGDGRAQAGTQLIGRVLVLASASGSAARQALHEFNHGAHRLAAGQRMAEVGSSALSLSAENLDFEVRRQLLPEAQQIKRSLRESAGSLPAAETAAAATIARLEAAWTELSEMGAETADPHLQALEIDVREALTAASGTDPVNGASFAPGYEGLERALQGMRLALADRAKEATNLEGRLRSTLDSVVFLRRLASTLQSGIIRLEHGSDRLAGGSDRIVAGATNLSTGLARLQAGARRLSDGIARLTAGNEALAEGLSLAFGRTRPLVRGAREAEIKVVSARRSLRGRTPGLFDSGYFVLSALDGAPSAQRVLASQTLDVGGGGQAAKILVIAKGKLDKPGMTDLNSRLRRSARELARRTGTKTAVTGGIAQTVDYTAATSARLPLLVAAITLATSLVLLAILRALPLAAIAITLNLFAVAAAFGVLRMLFVLPEGWPLGGTDHLDPVGAAGIFGIVFGLSIDYAVFLLMRMRESWERDGDHQAAIAFGLERTAGVITGAATIMAVVFGVFATAPIDTVAQFGVGLTVAVLLDATLIRLVLLPTLMASLGPRVWWLPAWLDRLLPRLNVDGATIPSYSAPASAGEEP